MGLQTSGELKSGVAGRWRSSLLILGLMLIPSAAALVLVSLQASSQPPPEKRREPLPANAKASTGSLVGNGASNPARAAVVPAGFPATTTVAAPAPTNSTLDRYERYKVFRDALTARRRARLEDAWTNSAPNEEWTGRVREFMTQELRRAAPAATLSNVDCRARLCRVELLFSSAANSAQANAILPYEHADIRVWIDETDQGEARATLFLSNSPDESLAAITENLAP